ncbi:tumor necrosis factor receptor superfamily member 1B [Ctenodactylus gundi]
MAPVALWATLAVGLQLFVTGHGVPNQVGDSRDCGAGGDPAARALGDPPRPGTRAPRVAVATAAARSENAPGVFRARRPGAWGRVAPHSRPCARDRRHSPCALEVARACPRRCPTARSGSVSGRLRAASSSRCPRKMETSRDTLVFDILITTARLRARLLSGSSRGSAKAPFMPYAPSEPGSGCRQREYLDPTSQMCCSKCPPGQHVKTLCNKTSDTVCAPCEDGTYTQVWNWVFKCLSCGARCSFDQVEIQACTGQRNRACACRPGWYCMLQNQGGCRLCMALRKCPPGYGVARQGTENSDVQCAPCAPGTFSDTISSTDVCRPHRTCSLVAIPGNASMDTVCMSMSSSVTAAPGPAHTLRSLSPRSPPLEPTPGPGAASSTAFLLPRPPVEEISTGSISLPVGLIVGVTALGLLLIGLVNCVIMTQRKKKPSCLQREAPVPHLPADKAWSAQGPEQQYLLTTAPSSSSSSLESSASAANSKESTAQQPQAPGMERARSPGDAWASPTGAESSSAGHGTQVNVTCIVNVCSSSEHGSQYSSQASAATEDPDAKSSGSPKEQKVPFSKEECPFESQRDTPETLLTSLEKPLPLGVPDAGMKLS